MRPPLAHLAAIVLATSAGVADSHAQGRSISGNGFDSGGINVKPEETVKNTTKTVKTVQFIAVSPERMWKSKDPKQKPITGSLLAFAREKQTGKVAIIQDEKVRLLVGKKDFTLPLDKLSDDDQTYIRGLEDSARIAGKLIEPPAAAKGADAAEHGEQQPDGTAAKPAEPAENASEKPQKKAE